MVDIERIPVRVHRGGEVVPAILHRDLSDPLHDVLEYPEYEQSHSQPAELKQTDESEETA